MFPSSSPSASPLVLCVPAWIFDVSRVELEVRADRWLPVVDGCRSCRYSRISEMQEVEAEAECLFLRAPSVIGPMIESDFHPAQKKQQVGLLRSGNPPLLSLSFRTAPVKSEKFASSSSRRGLTTAFPSTPPPSWPSSVG